MRLKDILHHFLIPTMFPLIDAPKRSSKPEKPSRQRLLQCIRPAATFSLLVGKIVSSMSRTSPVKIKLKTYGTFRGYKAAVLSVFGFDFQHVEQSRESQETRLGKCKYVKGCANTCFSTVHLHHFIYKRNSGAAPIIIFSPSLFCSLPRALESTISHIYNLQPW